MAYKAQWYTPSHIIKMDIEGDIALDDLAKINQDLMRLLNDNSDNTIYLFVDDTKIGRFPLQLRKIQSEFKFLKHPALERIISIGEVNPLVKYFFPMVAKITNTQFERYTTIEEALDFVQTQESSMQNMSSRA